MENETKEVKLEAQASESAGQEQKKLSYEELNNACMQLYQQNQQLLKQVKQLHLGVMLKRMDYLFEVLDKASLFDDEFVKSCVNELKEALAAKPTEEKSDTVEEK